MSADTYVLYRFFSADGGLLYVGMTKNPSRRFERHRGTKSWWSEVARIEMEHFATIEDLRDAERRAIQGEKPAHNIRMNGPSSKPPKPKTVIRLGLRTGHAYAFGLEDGTCPVGIIDEADSDGVTVTLYHWLIGAFIGRTMWIPFDSVRRWVKADVLSRDEMVGEGWNLNFVDAVFRMDPLASFQDKWTSRQEGAA